MEATKISNDDDIKRWLTGEIFIKTKTEIKNKFLDWKDLGKIISCPALNFVSK